MNIGLGNLLSSVTQNLIPGIQNPLSSGKTSNFLMQGLCFGASFMMPPGTQFLAAGLMGGQIPELLKGFNSLFQKMPQLNQDLLSTPELQDLNIQQGKKSGTRRVRRHQHQIENTKINRHNKIDEILNSNLAIEEKIILIAGLVCENLEEQLEGKLDEQAKMAKNLEGKEADASDGGKAQNTENKIQLLMQKLNRMQSMSSNLLQAFHTTKKAQIMNIRV
ncbi:MAG: hypothetical protein ACQES9_10465 [Myxococcota bacterium]